MVAIEFFSNETKAETITAEPVVYCTREDRRIELFNELLLQRQLSEQGLLEGVHPDQGPQPTGGHQGQQQDLAQVDDRISAQDAASHHHRRKAKDRQVEAHLVEDEELRADAEKKVRRLGVRERVVEPTQNVAATMLVQKGESKDRTRITSKTGTRRGGSRGSRGLLHPGNLLGDPVQPTSKLGPSKTVVHRASEHNVGSRVIA